MDVPVVQSILQYAAPVIALFYYFGATVISACTLQKGPKYRSGHSRRTVVSIVCFILATYVIQSVLLVMDSFVPIPRVSSVAANVNALSSVLLWFIFVITLHRVKRPVWYPHLGSWLITFVFEVVVFSLFASHHAVSTAVSIIFAVIWACRTLALLALLATYAAAQFKAKQPRSDEESSSLLKPKIISTPGQNQTSQPRGVYGSVAVTDDSNASLTDSEDSEAEGPADKEKKKRQQLVAERLKQDGNWFAYLRGFSIFIPMVWPSKQPRLYLNMIGCGLCILCTCVLKLVVPIQLGIIINILTTGNGSLYKAIGLYVFLRWVSSYAGIGMLRNLLWQPIERFSYVAITTAAYEQIMELSNDFHDDKQSGELYQAITQGSSINELLETVLFQLGPMVIDVFVGFWWLNHLFGPYIPLLAFATTAVYISIATQLNIKQSSVRREYQGLARKQNQIMYDTLGSWTTVSYFNRIPYEENRYQEVVTAHSAAQLLYDRMTYLYGALTNSPMELGFCGALLLVAHQILQGTNTVGDFAFLLTYWSVYTGPLIFFAHWHRRLLGDLVDAEQLLQVFRHERKVKDGVQTFHFKGGAVDFKDIHFSYDDSKQVIKGLSFTTKPGQKIAVVGETGGGKSTILKLLFRFYDVAAGSLSIDGQDVRDVTLESLRSHIGVVPQDPSLFNDTVMNNVRYSRLDASDEEVMEACKAAAVHDKILSFTDGYSSKVGEKGVKLSGGELQRIAIARAILKEPDIILLDEATSSVDTETESRIQSALYELTKGRTTFTVAHRLSTVVDADIILVIKDGGILEHGPPQELLAAKGKYYDLWCKQVGITSKAVTSEIAASNPTETMAKNEEDGGNEAKGVEQERPGSKERRNGWRPDAPDFVPRNLQSTTVSGAEQNSGGSFGIKTGSSKQGRTNGKEPSTRGKRQRAREDADKNAAATSTDGAADKVGNDTQQGDNMTANESDGRHKRMRHAQARRRDMSKSEPTGSSGSAGDGAIDTTLAPAGSCDGLATEQRRVSAPAGEGSQLTGQGRRNRRNRWKIRGQSSSQAHSEPQSTRTSGTWSSEPGVPTLAPTTVPNEGGDGKGANLGKGNVRFAHDA